MAAPAPSPPLIYPYTRVGSQSTAAPHTRDVSICKRISVSTYIYMHDRLKISFHRPRISNIYPRYKSVSSTLVVNDDDLVVLGFHTKTRHCNNNRTIYQSPTFRPQKSSTGGVFRVHALVLRRCPSTPPPAATNFLTALSLIHLQNPLLLQNQHNPQDS